MASMKLLIANKTFCGGSEDVKTKARFYFQPAVLEDTDTVVVSASRFLLI